jgi:hypothetical protein
MIYDIYIIYNIYIYIIYIYIQSRTIRILEGAGDQIPLQPDLTPKFWPLPRIHHLQRQCQRSATKYRNLRDMDKFTISLLGALSLIQKIQKISKVSSLQKSKPTNL